MRYVIGWNSYSTGYHDAVDHSVSSNSSVEMWIKSLQRKQVSGTWMGTTQKDYSASVYSRGRNSERRSSVLLNFTHLSPLFILSWRRMTGSCSRNKMVAMWPRAQEHWLDSNPDPFSKSLYPSASIALPFRTIVRIICSVGKSFQTVASFESVQVSSYQWVIYT